ncbi:non-ribosomal peptide synthetase [Gordonia defluvii]|uniref:Non-ribosomal peptide synthetase n=1 Tax=Gordonia defluvii TaxID=283718 RepID=A0ABP6L6J6_9ACTN|nr:non-ribosomal peptide synthetase [Gordonia sp. UBA5067]
MTTRDSLPASPIQRRIVLAAELRPDDPAPNWALASSLPGQTDPGRFAAAVASVLNESRAFTESFELTAEMDVLVRRDGIVHDVPVVSYPDEMAVAGRAGEIGDVVYPPSAARQFHAEVATCGEDAYFLFAGSHAVSDGFGYLQLIEDFAARYRDMAAELPDSSSSAEVLERLDRPRAEAVDYFRALFAGIEDLSVPGWDRRDEFGRIPGSIGRHDLDPELYRAAGALAGQVGVRRYSVLVAALAVTVSAMTGADSVVIATPMANRRCGPSAARTRGVRVNVLPLRFDLDPELTVVDLALVADSQLDQLIEFEQHPFSEFARSVVAADGLDAAAPSVGFTLYPRPLAVAVDGTSGRPVHVDRRFLQRPLSVTVEVGDDAKQLIVERADHLPPVDVAGMYQHVLAHAVGGPGKRLIGELVWDVETLTSRVDASTEFPTATLVSVFADAVAAHPDRPAVITDDVVLTFGELAERVGVVARWLDENAGHHVAVSLPAGPQLVATMLAVFASGRVYVPIDPDNLAVRLPKIAQAIRGLTVVVPAGAVAAAAARSGDAVVLCEPLDLPAGAWPPAPVDPDQVAYIFFTSGSTGVPKGVQITHGAAGRFFAGLQADTGIGAARWLNFHSISFDISMVELLSGLAAGGAVVIPELAVKRDPDALAAFVDRHQVEIVSQTASAFSIFADRLVAAPSITHIIQAGERLDFAAAGPFVSARPDVTVINAYGITETVMYHTAYRLPADPADFPDESVIGRPFADMSMEVVDDELRVLPRGVIGQLAVGGAGLMAGYLDAEATARVLRRVNGRLVYLTGDRGYLNADGDFVILGRNDGQVKLRGHRCELGEVENACLHSGLMSVARALVIGSGLEAELVCFGVPVDGATEAAIRDRLAGELPRYAIPDRVILIDALPTTVNGKVDRDSLIRCYTDTDQVDGPIAGAVGDSRMQTVVEQIWGAVLDGAEFGPDTRFFDAGGTSATVLRVRELLRRELGRQIDVVDLFEYCTPRALAGFLEEQAAANTAPTKEYQ